MLNQAKVRRADETGAQIPRSQRAVIRAGTTVIARVDGQLEFLVTKPLPLSDRTKLDDVSSDLRKYAPRIRQRSS